MIIPCAACAAYYETDVFVLPADVPQYRRRDVFSLYHRCRSPRYVKTMLRQTHDLRARHRPTVLHFRFLVRGQARKPMRAGLHADEFPGMQSCVFSPDILLKLTLAVAYGELCLCRRRIPIGPGAVTKTSFRLVEMPFGRDHSAGRAV